MQWHRLSAALLLSFTLGACGGGGGSVTSGDGDTETDNDNDSSDTVVTAPVDSSSGAADYRVLAFNDLGMHCMDREYSIYSILPPFNVLNAQVIKRGSEPELLDTNAVDVRYDAVADANGSINSSSVAKTDFWQYAQALFGADLQNGEGLKGCYMPADNPLAPGAQPMHYNGAQAWFSAEGIPITPLDDSNWTNPYPLLRVSAHDKVTGETLATLDAVVPVAQETDCQNCHASGKVATLKAALNWAQDSDLELQAKKNVLKLHDYKHNTQLEQSTPVLCASCHYSAALDLDGAGPQGEQVGKPTMSAAMHQHHGTLSDAGGNPLFPTSAPVEETCYQCHPGKTTQCQRGAMRDGGMQCNECHGGMLAVGNPERRPWLDLPACQSCHTGDALDHLSGADLLLADDGIRLRQAYRVGDAAATPIQASNQRFAENAGTLFRNSKGHGGVACEGCHGSTHAIWPAAGNDNVAAEQLQGHSGTLSDCSVCHTSLPLTLNGPHGMHNVGDARWSDEDGHGEAYERNPNTCKACHGTDLRGSPLGEMSRTRTIGRVTLQAGEQVRCDRCHGLP